MGYILGLYRDYIRGLYSLHSDFRGYVGAIWGYTRDIWGVI